jgi:DNA-binding NarL/FixJ family response regulator
MLLGLRLPRGAGETSDPLRILVVDRHSLFLSALSQLLSDALPQSSIETTTDSDEAIEIISDQHIDLAFCEVRSGPVGGPELVGRVNQLSPGTRVILLADPEDAPLLVASLSCGAVGFFTKDASPEEFLEGIDAVIAGHYVVGHRLVQSSLSRLSEPAPRVGRLDQLSAAEKGILALVGQGKSIRAIAASQAVSEKTVRNHLGSIYRKLDLRNRSEAILWSARAGLSDAASENR